MIRSAANKVMWVGRATVFLVGLAMILALLFGVTSMALAKDGDPWLLGRSNVATAITKLAGPVGVNGPMLQLINNNEGTNDTALALSVQAGEPPLRVNSDKVVTGFNADKVDGLNSADLLSSSTYVKTEAMSLTDGGANSTLLYCNSPSDKVLGGGFSGSSSTQIRSSYPYVNPMDSGGQGWSVAAREASSDGNSSVVDVYVLCADMTP
jgi:hypothetical protein